MKKALIPLLVILAVLIFDQSLKFHVKTTFSHKTGVNVFTSEPWTDSSPHPVQLYFIENEGMAFGLKLWGKHGKLFLTLFRLVAVSLIGYYLFLLLHAKARNGLLISISLVFAGAMGNIIDSVFYGVVFSESLDYGPPAAFMPESGGYAKLFYGKVVDMFYFPLLRGNWPEWMPIVGGERYEFFRPIFNVADAAITVGVMSVLVFHRRHFTSQHEDSNEDELPEGTQVASEAGTLPSAPDTMDQTIDPDSTDAEQNTDKSEADKDLPA